MLRELFHFVPRKFIVPHDAPKYCQKVLIPEALSEGTIIRSTVRRYYYQLKSGYTMWTMVYYASEEAMWSKIHWTTTISSSFTSGAKSLSWWDRPDTANSNLCTLEVAYDVCLCFMYSKRYYYQKLLCGARFTEGSQFLLHLSLAQRVYPVQ